MSMQNDELKDLTPILENVRRDLIPWRKGQVRVRFDMPEYRRLA